MPPKQKVTQYKNACITFWSPPDFKEDPRIAYFISAEEICPQTKRTHWQSYICLKQNFRLKALKKLIDDDKADIEKRKGNHAQADSYCSGFEKGHEPYTVPKEGFVKIYRKFGTPPKQGKRNDILDACEEIKTLKRKKDMYDSDAIIPVVAKYPRFVAAYYAHTHRYTEEYKPQLPWQEELFMKLSEEADRRNIIWYWSEMGGVGKSTTVTALVDHHGAVILPPSLKDAYFIYDGEGIAVFDFPKSFSEDEIPYELFEALKTGLIVSTKYESVVKRFPRPHIVVVANYPPNHDRMTQGRFDVNEIKQP